MKKTPQYEWPPKPLTAEQEWDVETALYEQIGENLTTQEKALFSQFTREDFVLTTARDHEYIDNNRKDEDRTLLYFTSYVKRKIVTNLPRIYSHYGRKLRFPPYSTHRAINMLSLENRDTMARLVIGYEFSKYQGWMKRQDESMLDYGYTENETIKFKERGDEIMNEVENELRTAYEAILSKKFHAESLTIQVEELDESPPSEECKEALDALCNAYKQSLSEEEQNAMKYIRGADIWLMHMQWGEDNNIWIPQIQFSSAPIIRYQNSELQIERYADIHEFETEEDCLRYLKMFDSLSEEHRHIIADEFEKSTIHPLKEESERKKSKCTSQKGEEAIDAEMEEIEKMYKNKTTILRNGGYEQKFYEINGESL